MSREGRLRRAFMVGTPLLFIGADRPAPDDGPVDGRRARPLDAGAHCPARHDGPARLRRVAHGRRRRQQERHPGPPGPPGLPGRAVRVRRGRRARDRSSGRARPRSDGRPARSILGSGRPPVLRQLAGRQPLGTRRRGSRGMDGHRNLDRSRAAGVGRRPRHRRLPGRLRPLRPARGAIRDGRAPPALMAVWRSTRRVADASSTTELSEHQPTRRRDPSCP